jgi:hypothetical protein
MLRFLIFDYDHDEKKKDLKKLELYIHHLIEINQLHYL